MIENYKILTVTHHTLNVEEIGHFVIKHDSSQELASHLSMMQDTFGIEEIMYLSTCNRVTYLFYGPDFDIESDVERFFSVACPHLSAEHLSKIGKFVAAYEGIHAVNHIFDLASSIDSLVVGEREIFRQFREAYAFAKEHRLAGDKLRLIEQATVRSAKEVYADTRIGEKPLSIVSLAIQKFRTQQLPQDASILLVGAGETNTLVGKFLKKYGYTNVRVFNRSIDNARKLTNMLGGEAFHLSELSESGQGFDALFVCTGATEAIIDEPLYRILVGRDASKKVVVDLGVPRNVDPRVVTDFNCHYIDIEQLRIIAEQNLNHRKGEVKDARIILRRRLAEFQSMYQQRQIEKALTRVSHEVKVMKNRALTSVYDKKIAALDDDAKTLVLEMMDYMEKKFVSIPMRLAKEEMAPDPKTGHRSRGKSRLAKA
jgi:glutamyl-tRNA reductase